MHSLTAATVATVPTTPNIIPTPITAMAAAGLDIMMNIPFTNNASPDTASAAATATRAIKMANPAIPKANMQAANAMTKGISTGAATNIINTTNTILRPLLVQGSRFRLLPPFGSEY